MATLVYETDKERKENVALYKSFQARLRIDPVDVDLGMTKVSIPLFLSSLVVDDIAANYVLLQTAPPHRHVLLLAVSRGRLPSLRQLAQSINGSRQAGMRRGHCRSAADHGATSYDLWLCGTTHCIYLVRLSSGNGPCMEQEF
jgi:hypothetical protein